MALYKKEILVKPNSTITVDGAILATRNFVNGFQDNATNKDSNGVFINYFFGDCFDSRTGNIFRVFSDACSSFYSMPNTNGLVKYDILDNSKIALKTEIPSLAGLATETYVDDAILNISIPALDLTAVNNTLVNHEGRIDALEEVSTGGTPDESGATFVID